MLTVSKKEVQKTPPITDRERFVYIFTSLALNPVVMGLSQERRDEILADLKSKFCPTLTNGDWYVLFHEVEKMRSDLTFELADLTTDDEQENIKSNFMKLVGDGNIGDIGKLAEKIKNKMKS